LYRIKNFISKHFLIFNVVMIFQ